MDELCLNSVWMKIIKHKNDTIDDRFVGLVLNLIDSGGLLYEKYSSTTEKYYLCLRFEKYTKVDLII